MAIEFDVNAALDALRAGQDLEGVQHSVQSESGNYDCSGAGVDAGGQEINSGDCSHHYANTAAQCPGYIPPTGNDLPSIPHNCTVVLADVGSCAALYANSVEGVNCISNVAGEQDNGLAEILTPQAADGSDFVSWGDSLGCSGHAGVCSLWVNEARAGTDDEIEITASFEPEAYLQNASYTSWPACQQNHRWCDHALRVQCGGWSITGRVHRCWATCSSVCVC